MSETKNECPSTGRDSIWPEPDLHSYYHPYLHSSQQSISTPICYYILITFSYAVIYISVTPLFTFVLPPLFTFLPAEHNHCACNPHCHHFVIQILLIFKCHKLCHLRQEVVPPWLRSHQRPTTNIHNFSFHSAQHHKSHTRLLLTMLLDTMFMRC